MSSVGKQCCYCQRPILQFDSVSLCDRCTSVHHEECWDRNGRCSTFRCPGVPRKMEGADVVAVVKRELTRTPDYPVDCPICSNTVYPGEIQGKWSHQDRDHPIGPGLLFVAAQKANPHKDWFGKKFLSKMLGNRSYFLPGAQVKGRSCGKCKRLFLWGVLVDEAYINKVISETEERWCPHCSTALIMGAIELRKDQQGAGIFTSAETPHLHKDWFGHNILDKYFYNRWHVDVKNLPARHCETCQYTEVAGHAIYRFN